MTDKPKRGQPRYRSLFWPFVLIGVGVLWLMGNLGIISGANIAALLQVWPVFLILIGLDLLFGRESPVIGMLIGAGGVVLLVVIALLGPSLGLGPTIETHQFTRPLGNAQSASVELGVTAGPLLVIANDSDNLIEADIRTVGPLLFSTGGSDAITRIRLEPENPVTGWFGLLDSSMDTEDFYWNVSLSPEIPLDLSFDLSASDATIDLGEMRLDRLQIDGSSGAMDLLLPVGEYPAEFDGSSGDWSVAVPAEARPSITLDDAGSGATRFDIGTGSVVDFELDMSSGPVDLVLESSVTLNLDMVDSGSGPLTVDVAEGAAVRLDVREGGSGRLDVLPGMVQISGDDEEGIWQTEGYDDAQYQLNIVISDRSSGDIIIR